MRWRELAPYVSRETHGALDPPFRSALLVCRQNRPSSRCEEDTTILTLDEFDENAASTAWTLIATHKIWDGLLLSSRAWNLSPGQYSASLREYKSELKIKPPENLTRLKSASKDRILERSSSLWKNPPHLWLSRSTHHGPADRNIGMFLYSGAEDRRVGSFTEEPLQYSKNLSPYIGRTRPLLIK